MVAPDHIYPESPPRVRVEWLLAGTRVAVAASALLAVTLETPEYIPPRLVASVLIGYLLYGLAVVALVWSPVRFGRGWDACRSRVRSDRVRTARQHDRQCGESVLRVVHVSRHQRDAALADASERSSPWSSPSAIYSAINVFGATVLDPDDFQLKTFPFVPPISSGSRRCSAISVRSSSVRISNSSDWRRGLDKSHVIRMTRSRK